ncbi:MAG: chemotaxis protein, partial [Burkholderiales bacterium PBB4]
MRTNLPVTDQAYTFPAEQTLVSVTDLKGRITYCNPAFVAVSGYSAAELLGQPHNLVRHPDMPEEAFRDMWDTIQAKQPWTGLVKNRRKNGDDYWVRANATPMVDGNDITGYLSVRTSPSRESVAAAEGLYATMLEEAAQGRKSTALFRGGVVRTDLWGRLQNLLRPGTVAKLGLIQMGVAALALASLAMGLPMGGTVVCVAVGALLAV